MRVTHPLNPTVWVATAPDSAALLNSLEFKLFLAGTAPCLPPGFPIQRDRQPVARSKAFDVATDDPKLASVPGRYASALFDLAKDKNTVSDVEADLDRFSGLLGESDDLKRLVRSPVISADDQSRALDMILDKVGVSTLTANFLKLVAQNRRLFAVADMISSFKAIAADARGEVTAEVTSAEALRDDQIEELKAALKAKVGKDVQLKAHVDPSILGGLIVKIGSRMVDTSLRSKLAAMRTQLKSVKS